MNPLRLSLLPMRLAVCRLEKDAPLPGWAVSADFFTISRTLDELSIVCPEQAVPTGVQMEAGWRGLKVQGPLDFSLTGILAGLAGVLAREAISLFAISTYDTDYLLVREKDLDHAIATLGKAGYEVLI